MKILHEMQLLLDNAKLSYDELVKAAKFIN